MIAHRGLIVQLNSEVKDDFRRLDESWVESSADSSKISPGSKDNEFRLQSSLGCTETTAGAPVSDWYEANLTPIQYIPQWPIKS